MARPGMTYQDRLLAAQIGARIRKLRGERSRNEFSADIDVDPASVRAWENGERCPSASAMLRICRNADVSADWLLGIGS